MKLLSLCAAFAVLPLAGSAAPPPRLTVTDLDGHIHDPFATKETRAAVLVFVDIDCPIANSYQPTLRRLAERFSPMGVAFFQIHPDPDLPVAEARKHARAFDIISPVVLDAKQALVVRLDARVTPETFVLTPDLATVYRGRIDDTYSTYGKRRPEPTTHDLETALLAVLAGRKIDSPRTEAIGCQILVQQP